MSRKTKKIGQTHNRDIRNRKDGRTEGWKSGRMELPPHFQSSYLPILQKYELTLRKLFQIKIIPAIEP